MADQANKTDSLKKYAVIEVYSGEYHQGFKSRDEAITFVHKRLDDTPREDNYEFRTLLVLDEWSSDDLLWGER